MKSIVEAKQTPVPLEFPKLMKRKSRDEVVLFFSEGIGISLNNTPKLGIPDVFTDCDYAFEDFYGTVTLSN